MTLSGSEVVGMAENHLHRLRTSITEAVTTKGKDSSEIDFIAKVTPQLDLRIALDQCIIRSCARRGDHHPMHPPPSVAAWDTALGTQKEVLKLPSRSSFLWTAQPCECVPMQ
eukprot:6481489-Amphidinium_carterae.1